MQYDDPGAITKEAAETILQRDMPEELLYMVVSVGLYEEDYDFAYRIIHQLASHPNNNVKGNAILCFGHLARRFRKLPKDQVQPLIEAALKETDGYISGQAHDAADDIRHFLGWEPGEDQRGQ
ncbi:MAG: hypothetical protein OEZ39_16660 [Gammaproteobacteria bacterium]|nr:hypothetical protein [Gammaproteobacteria bacterium]MDH5653492.1 hypothetical protein [Gammaproteobacteria bacterium]